MIYLCAFSDCGPYRAGCLCDLRYRPGRNWKSVERSTEHQNQNHRWGEIRGTQHLTMKTSFAVVSRLSLCRLESTLSIVSFIYGGTGWVGGGGGGDVNISEGIAWKVLSQSLPLGLDHPLKRLTPEEVGLSHMKEILSHCSHPINQFKSDQRLSTCLWLRWRVQPQFLLWKRCFL